MWGTGAVMPTEWDLWLKRLSWFVADYQPNAFADADDLAVTWIRQFPKGSQVPIMRALATALQTTYISQESYTNYFQSRITNEDFWSNAFFLDGPATEGQSGVITYKLVADEVNKKFGPILESQEPKWHMSANHVFVDDAIFSGDRVIKDYGQWWDSPPDPSIWPEYQRDDGPINIYVWTYVRHTAGEEHVRKWLDRTVTAYGYSCQVNFASALVLEDRNEFSTQSDVLWPASLTETAVETRFGDSTSRSKLRPVDPKAPSSAAGVFASAKDREALESEFMDAGLDILRQFNKAWAPLGYGRRPFGFGSLSVSYRNCPNNAPLALWWSIPSHGWTPLFARSTYAHRAEALGVATSAGASEDIPF
jgi:hypothetical protein